MAVYGAQQPEVAEVAPPDVEAVAAVVLPDAEAAAEVALPDAEVAQAAAHEVQPLAAEEAVHGVQRQAAEEAEPDVAVAAAAGPAARAERPSALPWAVAWASRPDPVLPWPAPPRSAPIVRAMESSPVAWRSTRSWLAG